MGADTVVHVPPLAYPVGDAEFQLAVHRRAHVDSTRIVLDEAVSHGVSNFILVSSAHATGRSVHRVLCESDDSNPASPYAQAKLESEAMALAYGERYSMNVVILRPSEIYGPGDKSILSALGRLAHRNLWLPLKGVETLLSLVFVDNLARAGLALVKATGHGAEARVFIVNDPVDYRPPDLYAAVCQVLGKRAMLFRAPLPVLRASASLGVRFRNIPKLRALALLRQLITPQRYCGHLFNEKVPNFPFVYFDDAIRTTLGTSSVPR